MGNSPNAVEENSEQSKEQQPHLSRPKSIVMMAGPLPPEFSGAALQSLYISEHLKRSGASITYISPTFQKTLIGKGKVRGFPVHRFYKKNHGTLAKLLFSLKVFWFLIDHRDQFDVIHMHGGGFLITGAPLICRLFGKKCIYKMTSFGEDDAQTIKNARLNIMKYALLRMADKVIAISSVLRKSYENCLLPRHKLALIPNAVDTRKFRPVTPDQKTALRQKLDLPRTKRIVVCIGSISVLKRTDYLLKAWESVIKQRDDVLLVLVGPFLNHEKQFGERMKREVSGAKFANNVLLTGKKDNVEEFLQAADIFAFCSKMEGFATVQIEAMACGLPCICTAIPGSTTDIFEDKKDAILIDENSPAEEFGRSLLRLINDDTLCQKLSKNALSVVKERFSLQTIGRQYEQVYNTLLSAPPGPQSFPLGYSFKSVTHG